MAAPAPLPARPALELDSGISVKKMQPDLIVGPGATIYRLPAGYDVGDEQGQMVPELGNICPGC